jgi:hypothetical protein
VFMLSEWVGMRRARSCKCACSVVEIAKDKGAEGKVDEIQGGRETSTKLCQ